MTDVVKLKDEKKAWEINFATVLKDIRGKPIIQGEEPFTLGDACLLALDTGTPSGEKEGLKPKLKRAKIIDKIMDAQELKKSISLPSDEITIIKDRVGEIISSAYVVNQVCMLLDPATEKE